MQNLFEYTDGLNQPMEAFYHATQPWNFPILPHWHYFIEIIYLQNGAVEATCGDYVYTLRAGDLIIFCPQKVHSVDILEDLNAPSGLNAAKKASQTRIFSSVKKPKRDTQHNAIYPIATNNSELQEEESAISYRVLKFDLNFLNTNNNFKTQFSKTLLHAFEENPENIYFSADMLQNTPIAGYMEDCIREMSCQDYGYDIISSSLASALLAELMRIWRKRGLCIDEIISDSSVGNRAFDEITQYIDNHYNETLQVQELAAQCNMSYSYFAKLFRKTYNQSCKEYIEFIRINKVLELLRFTNLDLTYISQETGFADCSHLIRTFKKKKGMTPKQWRKAYGYK
ncbi:MAG: AraC family transcriptional regulator [Butyribacter sp.]|nr:AraC family transcriptional regulator [bacterium]MDY3854196.1 AraC family transcriptional regulator [Butyribacter sp.]